MNYRKIHLLLLAVFSLLAIGSYLYVKSQGSTLARHFFSEDLTVASVADPDSKAVGESIAGAVMDSVYGAEGAEIVSQTFAFSPETREIVLKVTANRECAGRFLFFFNKVEEQSTDGAKLRRKEERRVNMDECEYDGNTIICKLNAPDWAEGLDGMILLTER